MVYNLQNQQTSFDFGGRGKTGRARVIRKMSGSMSQKGTPLKSPSKSLHRLRIQREKKQHSGEEVRKEGSISRVCLVHTYM